MPSYYRGPWAMPLSSPPYVAPPAARLYPPVPRFDPAPPARAFDDTPPIELPSSTAVHESGHCIGAICYSLRIEHAVVGRTAKHPAWDGYVTHSGGDVWGRLVLGLAGIAAERHIFGRERVIQSEDDPDADLAKALQHAMRIANRSDPQSVRAAIAHAESAALEIVRRHRDVLIDLAHRLDEEGELTGEEVADIVGPLPRGPSYEAMLREWERHQERVRYFVERRLAEQQRKAPPPPRRAGNSWDQVRAAGGAVMMSRSLGLITRGASFDAMTGECDAVISTGAMVRRSDWDGSYDEILDMSPQAIRLTRLSAGAPLLDSHRYGGGVGAILGSILPGSARIDAGKLICRVKLSRNSEAGRRVALDLADGHSFPLSAGYRVHSFVEQREFTPPRRIVTDWEPLEASIVTIPAEGTGTGLGLAA
ncbi:MAG: hypothetical protein IT537_30555 [Hyphomicrobiales bacterium]|nr:hypothetical protein [Hyphomicrobiales bacterium]